ncbi:unnamed protein product [Cuscuta epithymum]|uniref:Uncharacterized protein n=1 Tax=Cuscuta epithymum TaxID=186058 RepID=A0AAV0F8Q5_9ASTE|nr:unnamed protein product [Cuscuta epithymum]
MAIQLCYDPSKTEREVHNCVLFPPESGFHLACSCEECVPKLRELAGFEEKLKSKWRLVNDYLYQINWSHERCVFLSTTVERTKKLLDLLRDNLSRVSQKSGISFTLTRSASVAKLEETDLKIARLLVQHGLIDDFENENAIEICDDVGGGGHDDDVDEEDGNGDEEEEEDKTDEILPIGPKVNSLLYFYGETKVKGAAHSLLEDINNLEKELWNAKKSAEAENKPMDPLISTKYFEGKIRLLKMLPVEELYDEVNELLPQLTHRHEKVERALTALDDMSTTIRAMIQIRNEFLQKHNKCVV